MSSLSRSKWPRIPSSGHIVEVQIGAGCGIASSFSLLGYDAADKKLGKDLTLSNGDRTGEREVPWKYSLGADAPRVASAASKGERALPLDGPQRSA